MLKRLLYSDLCNEEIASLTLEQIAIIDANELDNYQKEKHEENEALRIEFEQSRFNA